MLLVNSIDVGSWVAVGSSTAVEVGSTLVGSAVVGTAVVGANTVLITELDDRLGVAIGGWV